MISEVVIKKIEELTELGSVDPNVYVLDNLIFRDLNAFDKASEYVNTAMEMLDEAKDGIEKDLRKSSECIWCAVLLGLKAYALYKGDGNLASYEDICKYKEKVGSEFGEWVDDVFRHGLSMFINAYNSWLSKSDVEKSYKKVERLIRTISNRIRS